MNCLLLVVVLVGAEPDRELEAQKQREWLVANLIVAKNFNPQQVEEIQGKLSRMTPSQVNTLVEVYKMRDAEVRQARANAQYFREQTLLNQAKLNLERSRAYRDHLGREYQYKMLVENQLLEFMKRSRYWTSGAAFGNRYGNHYNYGSGYRSRSYRSPQYSPGYGYR